MYIKDLVSLVHRTFEKNSNGNETRLLWSVFVERFLSAPGSRTPINLLKSGVRSCRGRVYRGDHILPSDSRTPDGRDSSHLHPTLPSQRTGGVDSVLPSTSVRAVHLHQEPRYDVTSVEPVDDVVDERPGRPAV